MDWKKECCISRMGKDLNLTYSVNFEKDGLPPKDFLIRRMQELWNRTFTEECQTQFLQQLDMTLECAMTQSICDDIDIVKEYEDNGYNQILNPKVEKDRDDSLQEITKHDFYQDLRLRSNSVDSLSLQKQPRKLKIESEGWNRVRHLLEKHNIQNEDENFCSKNNSLKETNTHPQSNKCQESNSKEIITIEDSDNSANSITLVINRLKPKVKNLDSKI